MQLFQKLQKKVKNKECKSARKRKECQKSEECN